MKGGSETSVAWCSALRIVVGTEVSLSGFCGKNYFDKEERDPFTSVTSQNNLGDRRKHDRNASALHKAKLELLVRIAELEASRREVWTSVPTPKVSMATRPAKVSLLSSVMYTPVCLGGMAGSEGAWDELGM